MIFPLYYIPPGIEIPGHINTKGVDLFRARPGMMPDCMRTDDGAKQTEGGLMIGGQLSEHVSRLFQKTSEGWAVALGNVTPRNLARARGIGGRVIPGREPGQEWCVPTLLQIVQLPDGSRSLTGAIPKEYRNYQWQTPQEYYGVIDKLGAFLRSDSDPTLDEMLNIAADILAVNYNISKHELSVSGWIDEPMLLRVINAAVNVGE
jgi:hypothetical protein